MITSYSLFSSEKVDGTKTRRIFRREFNHLTPGDFGDETREITLAGARHGIHSLALRR